MAETRYRLNVHKAFEPFCHLFYATVGWNQLAAGSIESGGEMSDNASIKRPANDTVMPGQAYPMGRKIKILRIISRLNIGGPSIHMKVLVEGLNNRTYESFLVVGQLGVSEGDMGYLMDESRHRMTKVPSLQRELSPTKDLNALLQVFKLLKHYRPNIVHTHMAKAGVVGRVAVIVVNCFPGRKIKLVHTFHGNVLEGYFGKTKSTVFQMIERFLSVFTDRIIAISKTQKMDLAEKLKITSSSGKIEIIPLGFNLKPLFNLEKLRGNFRKQIQVKKDIILVGIIGRLVPIKNHHLFLDVARLIVGQNKRTDVRFVVVGDGELRKELEVYAKKISVEDYVYFHGWERNISNVYADLDLLALTSKNEGTPVSIIEAMAASVPVITTDVGGTKDLLGMKINSSNHKGGFEIHERGVLCPREDADALANGIEYLVDHHDHVESSIRVALAREYATRNFSDTRLVNNMEQLYEKIA